MNTATLNKTTLKPHIERRRRCQKRREFDRAIRRAGKADDDRIVIDPATYQNVHSCSYTSGDPDNLFAG